MRIRLADLMVGKGGLTVTPKLVRREADRNTWTLISS